MKLKIGFIIVFLFNIVYAIAIINENERIHEHKLSEKEHFIENDKDQLSEHNPDYDHEAFLGVEEAESFKKLTAEESEEKLGKIVDKIDIDNDGFVSLDELQSWIRNISKLYISRSVESRWAQYDQNNTGFISIDSLLDVNYGSLQFWTAEDKEKKKDELKNYNRLMEREKKRFKYADRDHDGKLNKTEYSDFLHPEEVPYMRDIVIIETLEDLDKDGDSFVTIDEYLVDLMYANENKDDEPEWLKTERETFKKYRDLNGDGKLDYYEVSAWILPADYDHSLAEAKHLIYLTDSDHDGKLTKKEILDKSNVFVSSKATEYGDAIHKHIDL